MQPENFTYDPPPQAAQEAESVMTETTDAKARRIANQVYKETAGFSGVQLNGLTAAIISLCRAYGDERHNAALNTAAAQAEHLNGWGTVPRPELADNIARI